MRNVRSTEVEAGVEKIEMKKENMVDVKVEVEAEAKTEKESELEVEVEV